VRNETRYTLRLDHNFTNNAKVNFRYTLTPAVGIRGAGNDINGNTGVYSDARQFLLAFNNIISPTIVNDLRLSYTRGNFSEDYSPEFAIKTGRSYAGDIGLMRRRWLTRYSEDGQYRASSACLAARPTYLLSPILTNWADLPLQHIWPNACFRS
jgi:hypothetical protein